MIPSTRKTHRAELAIFRVSKATFDEATSIFYSESVFRHHFDAYLNSAMYSPGAASNRMMKIGIDCRLGFCRGFPTQPHAVELDLCATLDKFSGLSHLRNTISINLQLAPLYTREVLSRRLFRRLKTLVGFRTVVVNIDPPPDLMSYFLGFEENRMGRMGKDYKKIAEAIKAELVPTLGPTAVRQVDLSTYLEFHPLEHMQAEDSEVKMSKLNLEADRSEQGE